MSFSVFGLKELQRGFAKLGAATASGEARAVNRVATSIITAQSRAIVQIVNLGVTRVKQAIQVKQRASAALPQIVLQVQRRPIGLIEFAGRWTGPKSVGASAAVLVGEGRHTYAGTFIAVGRGGNRQIFSRKIVGGKRAGRLPLKTLYGPSVYSEFKRDDITEVGRQTWETRLPIELQREIAFALTQAGIS